MRLDAGYGSGDPRLSLQLEILFVHGFVFRQSTGQISMPDIVGGGPAPLPYQHMNASSVPRSYIHKEAERATEAVICREGEGYV